MKPMLINRISKRALVFLLIIVVFSGALPHLDEQVQASWIDDFFYDFFRGVDKVNKAITEAVNKNLVLNNLAKAYFDYKNAPFAKELFEHSLEERNRYRDGNEGRRTKDERRKTAPCRNLPNWLA